MPRLLLLLPTTTYRAEAFLEAARKLKLDVVVGSKRAAMLDDLGDALFLPLNLHDLDEAVRSVVEFARATPIDVVVGVDDHTTVVATAISAALGLPHNPVPAVAAARNKHRMRELLSEQGVPVPRFALFSVDDDPEVLVAPSPTPLSIAFPCVVKPISLSASCGVIRANNRGELVAAFHRVATLLEKLGRETVGEGAGKILVEDFVPGREVALEGLLTDGELQVLALFDKPDPLDGPFFEETIYVTPSRLPEAVQREIASCAARAALAVPGIEDLEITAQPGDELVPLPEGTRYLGFLIARGKTPEAVETALRDAQRRLKFIISPVPAETKRSRAMSF